MRRTLTTLLIAFASSVVMTLAGCADSGGIVSTARLAEPDALGARDLFVGDGGEAIGAEWWRAFADDQLDALVARAVDGSPSLRAAAARTLRAGANIDAIRANDGPQLNGQVDAVRQRFTENGLYPPPIAGSIRTNATLQLVGTWEFDFFGRNRAQLDAALGSRRAAEADAAAARAVLAVNVTRSYVQLARLVEQRDVLSRSLAQRDEVLALIRQRVGAGLDTNVELRQGEGALPETRQQLESLEEQIALTRHALAALTAEPPERYALLTPRLGSVRAVALPAYVPADLIGRRADIVAARWRVEAATSDVAAARAAFYPNFNLTGFVGLSSFGLDRVLNSDSQQYGIGPAIRLPILDAGRLRAGLRGRAADLDAAVENYNGTLIDAIHDVADQIASVRSVQRQQEQQAEAQIAADSAYGLARQRYGAGLATYLTVLNAETNVIAQRRISTDLRARALDAQLLLIRALGGGYAAPAEARGLPLAAAAAEPIALKNRP